MMGMKKNNGLKAFIAILSILASLAAAAFSIYLGVLGTWWFIVIGCYFITEALMIFIGSLIKDEYKGMRVFGVAQIIGVLIMMDFLLVMILWNDYPTHLIPFNLSYIVYGACAGVKLLTCLIATIANKKHYNPMMHAFRNGDLLTVFYFILIVELIITNYFFPGTGDGLLKEKPIWIYVIDVGANATLTILAALLALSTDIYAKEREVLSTGGKIKHVITWFNDNELSMFFGLIFTSYLAVLAFINARTSWFYVFLGLYYILTALVRFINYIWHRIILKKVGNNQIRENRYSSFILLFDSLAFLFLSNVIAAGAIIIMLDKSNTGTNIYLFLFMIVPFGIMRFVNAIKEIKNGRVNNNTYKLGLGLMSLITGFFAILEILAILSHGMNITLKYILIISMVVIVKIVVIVICIIFLVHFFRSLIVNRKSKEKR